MITEDVVKKLFTVEEMAHMEAVGIFPPGSRLELIRGEIIQIPESTTWHCGRVNKLNRLFTLALADRVIVSVQNEAVIRPQRGAMSRPKPDIAILKPLPEFFGPWAPVPEEILLLVEISDTTGKYDHLIKAPLYAEAGIVEYWILNISEKTLEIHTQPVDGIYRSVRILRPGDTASPQKLPDVTFAVHDILL